MIKIADHINRAFQLFDKGDFTASEQLYNECLQEIHDKSSEEYRQVIHGLGYVKSHQKQFDQARKLYTELLDLAKQQDNKMNEAIANHQFGMVERIAENYDRAMSCFNKEIEILQKHLPDFLTGFAANYYERGYIALQKKSLSNALELIKTSLNYALTSEDPVSIGCAYRGLGEIYSAKKETNEAVEYFDKAKIAFEQVNDPLAVSEVEDLIDKTVQL